MPPTERDRLTHMLEAASDVVQFTAGRVRADLDRDRMLRRALVQCIEVIGEASVHVSPGTRAQMLGVPWRNVRGMRNLLAHAYFGINPDILWQTATQEIPPLAAALQEALGPEPGPAR
jgi:uncharacterized protein with HEPN domain